MVDVNFAPNTIERRSDLGPGDPGLYAYWMGQEKIADREERKWVKRAREIVKRYRDERPEASQSTHRFNILWSNVQTLIPTLYGRTPRADVERRFRDQDDVGRLAATIMERCIDFSTDNSDFDDVMEAVVEDRLLPGRGVARVLYIPHFGEPISETEDGDDDPAFEDTEAAPVDVDNPGDEGADEGAEPSLQPADEPLREVEFEEVIPSYVFWEDYKEGPARNWREVPWLRYRAYMDFDALVKRFGRPKAKKVNLDYAPKGTAESAKEEPPPDIFKKAIVFEFWDKTKKRVVWLAPGTPDLILDDVEDPLGLPDFYPQGNPLRSTTSNDKRTPIPDYIEYQDQARELDTLTARIDRLTRALKVSGIYPGEEKQILQQLVDEGTENRLIPVEDWPRWSDKGTLDNLIQWMPIKQVAETLIQLYDARDRVKQILYEITGIGDIMRGQTNPNETLGAQELKANFSTRRIVPQQRKVAKFARDIFRLMGQVIALHFSPQTISKMSGYPQLAPIPALPPMPAQFLPQPMAQGNVVPMQQPGQPPAQPMANPAFAQWQQAQQAQQQVIQKNAQLQAQFDAALKLMRDDIRHGFRIDIEADSTIAPDENAEKQARTEFISEAVPLLQQLVPFAQGNPPMAEAAKQLFLFGVRAFKTARPLEETFEKAFDAIAQMPPHPSQQAQKSGVDSPGDLALRGKQLQVDGAEAAAKIQVAQQANAIKAEQVSSQERLGQMRLAQEAEAERSRMAIQASEAADVARFRQTRGEGIQARTAGELA